jgi:hypothetical protein
MMLLGVVVLLLAATVLVSPMEDVIEEEVNPWEHSSRTI